MSTKKIKKTMAIFGLFFILTGNVQAFADSYTKLTGDFVGSSIFNATSNSSTTKQTNAASSTLEQRYGFDSNIMRRAALGQEATQVSINFDNPAPKEGDIVTALALAERYSTEPDKLYYTWFLIRAEDKLGEAETMETAKRRAAKIMAQGKFNPAYFATDYETNNTTDADKDYFRAPFGGADGVGGREGDAETYLGIGKYEESSYSDAAKRVVDSAKITRCYRHNYGYSFEEDGEEKQGKAGKDLVIECKHKFPKTKEDDEAVSVMEFCDSSPDATYVLGTGTSETPESGFTTDEEACWSLDPNNPDTDGDGVPDEADLIGVGQDQFKWKYQDGDRVGVVVEGTTSTVINEEAAPEDYEELSRYARQAQCTEAKTDCLAECNKLKAASEDTVDLEGTTDGTNIDLDGSITNSTIGFTEQDYQICKSGCLETETACINGAEAYIETYNTQARLQAEKDALFGYSKIMWTGIDVCTEDKIDLMEKDECDGASDVGFTFLASKLVKEKAGENLEAKVSVYPEVPQISTMDANSSDYVTLKSEVSNETTDDTFAYYKWEIYACGEGTMEACLLPANQLTKNCGEGSSLEECTKMDKDGDGVPETVVLKSTSSAEGMGLREISFQPQTEDLLPKEKTFLKVLIKTKRDKNTAQYSVTEVDVPFTKANTGIRFFKVSETSPGVFGFNEATDEICNKKEEGVKDGYDSICPVFPYQIIAAKSAVNETVNAEKFSYNWAVDSEQLKPLVGCPFAGGCADGVVYFVVQGDDLAREVVTLNTKEDKADKGMNNSTAEKIYSINNPMGLIKLDSEDVNVAWATLQSNGTGAEGLFEAVAGKEVSFRVSLIPNYLNTQEGKKDVDVIWELNGEEITEDYATLFPDSGITLEDNGKKINFLVSDTLGDKNSLRVTVRKSILVDEDDTDEEKARKEREQIMLEKTFGILDYRDTETTASAEIKVVEEPLTAMERGSLKLFFASTIKNAPEYLIFSMRLAIMLILGWSFLFGFSYLAGSQQDNLFSTRKYL